jgi:hypothetical protein
VPREANKVAHLLAKAAVSQMLDNSWIEECPSYIQSCVLAEKKTSFLMIFIFSQKIKNKKKVSFFFFFFFKVIRNRPSRSL